MTAVPPSAGTTAPRNAPPPAAAGGSSLSRHSAVMSTSLGLVSVVGYVGTLLMAHLLDAPSYSDYAAAAMLLAMVGTFAAALIPMPLTHVIRNSPRQSEARRRGLAFAWFVSGTAGMLAAFVTGAITATFAPATVVAAVAACALILFACSPIWAWLNGELRFSRIAVISVAEVAARVLFAVGVVVLGWRTGGALLGFAVGVVVVLATAPAAMRRDLAWRPDVLKERERWTETGDIALARLTTSALVGADVVLVAMLGAPAVQSAGYQALSTLAKAPVYIAAGATAVAFPLLRSGTAQVRSILTTTMRCFCLMAFPAAAVVATAPRELILVALPDRYANAIELLPPLAAAGVGYAALTMFATVLLGLRAYRRCQLGLLAAVLLLALGMLLGWRIGGVGGLADGTALGALAGAAGLMAATGSLLPASAFRSSVPALTFSAVVFGLLKLVQSLPVVWIVVVAIAGAAVLNELHRGRGPAGGASAAATPQPGAEVR